MKTSDSSELRDKLIGLGKSSMRKNYYAELLKEKQMLEERIKERTKELEIANQNLEQSYKDLQRTQDYLLQTEKLAALGALVAGISHEVNTPLGICMTSTTYLVSQLEELRRLASEKKLSIKQLDEFTRKSLDASGIILNNMTRSIDLLNNFKMIAVDQSQYEYRLFSLNDYLDKILKNLHSELKKRDTKVSVHCHEELEIMGYPGILNQIISNLIMNSLIHGYVHTRPMEIIIACSVEMTDDQTRRITITYSDNGKGMLAEIAQKAFNPFFTTTLGSGGNGMGLYIIHNLITRLQGTISLFTEPDQGVTFSIVFPEKEIAFSENDR